MNYLGITWLKFNPHFPPTEDIVGLWINSTNIDICSGSVELNSRQKLQFNGGLLKEMGSWFCTNHMPDYFRPLPPYENITNISSPPPNQAS